MNKLTLGIIAAMFSTSASASWSIVDIGELLGKEKISVAAINDWGQITGEVRISDSVSHAYLASANGNFKDLGTIGASNSSGFGINNFGQVIGNLSQEYIPSGSFITGPNGQGMTIFATDDGAATTSIRLSGINDSGMVTGGYFNEDGSGKSFVADSNGSIIRVVSQSESTAGPSAINNSGQVAGNFISSDGRTPKVHAFITNSDGSIRDLSNPGEKHYTRSEANDINNSGQVAGTLSMGNYRWSQAFITGDDGVGMIKLGTLGHTGSYAVAINDIGQVIGISTYGNEPGFFKYIDSFIYANGGLTNLSALPEVINAGWTSLFVSDINNNGQIIGTGYRDNDLDNPHPFLLSFTSDTVFTPRDFYIPLVPEPSTYLMLLAGLGLLGFVGYNKKATRL